MKFFKKLICYLIHRCNGILYRIRRPYIFHSIKRKVDYSKVCPESWQISLFLDSVRIFLSSLKLPGEFEYRYSTSCNKPTLYASVYACMTFSLLGDLQKLSEEIKHGWSDYFDGFQSADDGLFYDSVLDSGLYRSRDWWGARHLALHMISVYNDLGTKPKYPFFFLREYYDTNYIAQWLDSFDWSGTVGLHDDVDNKIMNIGCLLQYQRDTWGDEKAGLSVAYLQKYLSERINPKTGMWGYGYDMKNPHQRSRAVQFAYHLYPIFFYDKVTIPHLVKAIPYVLETQNSVGGFGVPLNSSACEDIDSIDILIRCSYLFPEYRSEIDMALRKAFRWVLCNQVKDGGFVFRLGEEFVYGHKEMSSDSNCGAMFPTWFRCLSLAYLSRYFNIDGFKINSAPGLEN